MTAIRRIATAYLWNRIPRISHLLRADFYYGGFDNGVTPPTFQMAIDATVVTNISSSLNAEYSYENAVPTQGTVALISLPPPRFKQFPFSFTSAIALLLAAENTSSSYGNTPSTEINMFGHRSDWTNMTLTRYVYHIKTLSSVLVRSNNILSIYCQLFNPWMPLASRDFMVSM